VKAEAMAALALSCVFGDSAWHKREPIRIKDPAKDVERIAAAEAKRIRKAAKRKPTTPPPCGSEGK
jgi:hypothetical protein